jgi:hypothetical protein
MHICNAHSVHSAQSAESAQRTERTEQRGAEKHTMHNTVYTIHSTPYTTHNTQHTTHHTVQSTPYSIHHTLYTIQNTQHSTPYTIHNTQYSTPYTTHNTVHHTPHSTEPAPKQAEAELNTNNSKQAHLLLLLGQQIRHGFAHNALSGQPLLAHAHGARGDDDDVLAVLPEPRRVLDQVRDAAEARIAVRVGDHAGARLDDYPLHGGEVLAVEDRHEEVWRCDYPCLCLCLCPCLCERAVPEEVP